MCFIFVLTVLMCYSIGSGIGWDTLALLSQSDLDCREQVIRGMGRGYLGLRRHVVYGQFEQRVCFVALLFRDKVASLVCKVHLKLLKMGVARNMYSRQINK